MLIQRLQTAVIGVTFLLMGHDLGAQESLVPVPEQPPQPPHLSDEDFQVLTRGPIHEAFAEQLSQKPAAGTRVDRRPPEPIDEIPPEAKPEGDDISWIPGYWYWDGERSDFIWISGVWRNMPPDRRWGSRILVRSRWSICLDIRILGRGGVSRVGVCARSTGKSRSRAL